MPQFNRQDMLATFRAMIERNEPIIGGGAGTGLSAKWEEAGGIDLIVIYNSGRYRMAGHGSLAGLLAYGNANEIVVDMAKEVLPVAKNTPVLAGVNATDSSNRPRRSKESRSDRTLAMAGRFTYRRSSLSLLETKGTSCVLARATSCPSSFGRS